MINDEALRTLYLGHKLRVKRKEAQEILMEEMYFFNGTGIHPKVKSIGAGIYEVTDGGAE